MNASVPDERALIFRNDRIHNFVQSIRQDFCKDLVGTANERDWAEVIEIEGLLFLGNQDNERRIRATDNFCIGTEVVHHSEYVALDHLPTLLDGPEIKAIRARAFIALIAPDSALDFLF